jgi:hypothetical protein
MLVDVGAELSQHLIGIGIAVIHQLIGKKAM